MSHKTPAFNAQFIVPTMGEMRCLPSSKTTGRSFQRPAVHFMQNEVEQQFQEMKPAPTQTCSSLRLSEPCSHPQLVHDWHLASPPDAEGRPVVVRQTHKDWSLYVTCKSRPSRAGCVLASAGYLLWRYLRHNRQLTPKGSPGSHNVQHKCEETTANNGNNMTTLCKKMLEFCASKNIQKFTFWRCRPRKEHADICASFSSEM